MPYILMVALLIAALAGWMGRGRWDAGEILAAEAKLQEREAAVQKQVAEERERQEEWARRFETRLANLRVVNRTINNEIRRELEKTVYTDCAVPESGSLLIRRNVDQANAVTTGIVPLKVPPAAPPP
jgi:Tfp pilus assembly protein PilX